MTHPPGPPIVPSTSAADDDRDAWLSEALRHAPDADVAPPAALSEMILREAQLKARPAVVSAPRPPMPFWSRVWVWSAQPAVGAGLASVMVAGLVGVMLWDRPLEENRPRSVPQVARAPASAPTSAADAAVAPSAQLNQAAPEAATKLSATEAKPAPKPNRELADATVLAKKLADESERRRESTQTRVAAAPRSTDEFDKPADAGKSADTPARPDALAKAARTGEAMSPAAPAVTATPAPAPEQAPGMAAAPPVKETSAAPRRQAITPPPAAPAPMTLKRESAVAGGAPLASQSQLAAKAEGKVALASIERSLVSLRSSLAAEPAQWSWQRNGGDTHRIDDALTGFLAEVDTTSAGRWDTPIANTPTDQAGSETASRSAKTGPAARAADTSGAVHVIRLMRDGKPVHTLRLDGNRLRWERASPDDSRPASASEVELDDSQAQRIRRALDKLGP
jgi:hypothetical protein